jgi:hypothetical protein
LERGDVLGSAETLVPYFVPVHALGGLAFGAGVMAFARGLATSDLIRCHRQRRLVIGALIVMPVARTAPVIFLQFYVQSLAAVVALWSIAFELRRIHQERAAQLPAAASVTPGPLAKA